MIIYKFYCTIQEFNLCVILRNDTYMFIYRWFSLFYIHFKYKNYRRKSSSSNLEDTNSFHITLIELLYTKYKLTWKYYSIRVNFYLSSSLIEGLRWIIWQTFHTRVVPVKMPGMAGTQIWFWYGGCYSIYRFCS